MAIPDYQTIMLPLLKFLSDEKEHSRKEVIKHISELFNLSEKEKRELLPSGSTLIINNRVGWARTYLKKAGLLEYPIRGYMKITKRGLTILKQNPLKINIKSLEKFPEFLEFRKTKTNRKTKSKLKVELSEQTPKETLEYAHEQITNQLAQTLLEEVKKKSPIFFEKLVVDLVVSMGYGGSRKDAGERIGRSGDEGIDGLIKEDKLGLDVIYIQAKRWKGTVGRPEIHKFVGALQGKHARKGIFITTGNFSHEAVNYVKNLGIKIALIDGKKLTELMIDHNVGVSIEQPYELKEIDVDYFDEEL